MSVLESPSPVHQHGTNRRTWEADQRRLDAVLPHSPALLLPTAVFSILTLLWAIQEARKGQISFNLNTK